MSVRLKTGCRQNPKSNSTYWCAKLISYPTVFLRLEVFKCGETQRRETLLVLNFAGIVGVLWNRTDRPVLLKSYLNGLLAD
jgi:hypothetical protein